MQEGFFLHPGANVSNTSERLSVDINPLYQVGVFDRSWVGNARALTRTK